MMETQGPTSHALMKQGWGNLWKGIVPTPLRHLPPQVTFILSNPGGESFTLEQHWGNLQDRGAWREETWWLSLLSSPSTFSWYVLIRALAVTPEPG